MPLSEHRVRDLLGSEPLLPRAADVVKEESLDSLDGPVSLDLQEPLGHPIDLAFVAPDRTANPRTALCGSSEQ